MAYPVTEDIRAYTGVEKSGDDALIDSFITEAVAFVEAYVGVGFDGTSTSTRKFDAISDVKGRELSFDKPAVSLTTVTNNADASSPTVIGTSAYVTMPRNETPYWGIKLLASGNNEWQFTDDPEEGITVLGNFRWSVTPPSDVAWAVKRLAVFLYRQKDTSSDLDRPLITGDGVTIMPSRFPKDVIEILNHYRSRYVG